MVSCQTTMDGCTKFRQKITGIKDLIGRWFFYFREENQKWQYFFPFSNHNTYLCRPKINGL